MSQEDRPVAAQEPIATEKFDVPGIDDYLGEMGVAFSMFKEKVKPRFVAWTKREQALAESAWRCSWESRALLAKKGAITNAAPCARCAELETRLEGGTHAFERVSGRFDELQAKITEQAAEISELEKERNNLIAGVKVSVPTDSMEQAFSIYHRRGYEAGKRDTEQKRPAIPEGMALVPIEATKAMREVGAAIINSGDCYDSVTIYEAMIAAAGVKS